MGNHERGHEIVQNIGAGFCHQAHSIQFLQPQRRFLLRERKDQRAIDSPPILHENHVFLSIWSELREPEICWLYQQEFNAPLRTDGNFTAETSRELRVNLCHCLIQGHFGKLVNIQDYANVVQGRDRVPHANTFLIFRE